MTESKNRFSRSDIASFLAVLLSIAALVIGIIEAQIMAKQQEIMAEQQEVMVDQQKGSVWPYVETESNLLIQDSLVFSWTAENKGVGPAIINEINLTVAEKPYNSFQQLTSLMDSLLGKENYNLVRFGISKTTKSVYAPGEKKVLFQLTTYDSDLFFKKVGFFNLTLKYCSIYGDCWSENGTPLEEGMETSSN